VHIAPVEGMGVADHEARPGGFRHIQGGLEVNTVPNVNLYRGFHVMTLER
jgi:hypothetical protein